MSQSTDENIIIVMKCSFQWHDGHPVQTVNFDFMKQLTSKNHECITIWCVVRCGAKCHTHSSNSQTRQLMLNKLRTLSAQL